MKLQTQINARKEEKIMSLMQEKFTLKMNKYGVWSSKIGSCIHYRLSFTKWAKLIGTKKIIFNSVWDSNFGSCIYYTLSLTIINNKKPISN